MDTALSPNERRRKRRAEQALADALYDPTDTDNPNEFKTATVKPIPVKKSSRYNDESRTPVRKMDQTKDTYEQKQTVQSKTKVTQPVKKRARTRSKDAVSKPSIVYQQECEDWANLSVDMSEMTEASRNLSYSMADDVASYICSQDLGNGVNVGKEEKKINARQRNAAAILVPPSFDSIPPPSLYQGLDGESQQRSVLYGQVERREEEEHLEEQEQEEPAEQAAVEQILEEPKQEQSLHLASFEFEPPRITASKSKANIKVREQDDKEVKTPSSVSTDAQRLAYEDILNKQLLHKSEPLWWREQFHLVGRKMVHDVEKLIEAKVSKGAKINPERIAAFTERQPSSSLSSRASSSQAGKGKQDVSSPILVGGGYCSSMEPSPRNAKPIIIMASSTSTRLPPESDSMVANSTKTFTVGYKGTLYSFSKEVLIGRQEGCDIRLTEAKDGECFSSRIQMALYPLPKYNMICIVDLGSLNGLKQKDRADTARPREHSFIGARKNILIGWPEWSVIEMGGVQSREELLVIFPKECCICMSAPRDYMFEKCGHYCACVECARKLDACPLCRKADQDIVRVDPGFESAVARVAKKHRL